MSYIQLRSLILDNLDVDDEDFSAIARRYNVTFDVVWALAFDPNSSAICSECEGAGKIVGQHGEGQCDYCHGAGCKTR